MALERVTVVGGGLAGVEAAVAAARHGVPVTLYEMRPTVTTAAHETALLAELVCSNSLKSTKITNASGLLKEELKRLGSVILAAAEETAVPAGDALAVDRTLFAETVTRAVEATPGITLVREEVTRVEGIVPCIVATGPLTSDALSTELAALCAGAARAKGRPAVRNLLAFYDAISPIVAADSITPERVFRASRRDTREGDYLNCPLTPDGYRQFVHDLAQAETAPLKYFERAAFFEGCLPVEEIARRGEDALRFGPMKPVGLVDPRTGQMPYAVVQLRVENKEATMYNLVGFQTRLKWGEQKRIFCTIPGLEEAEILRYGSVHRNTYINAPATLTPTLELAGHPGLFLAGQITGVEGYVESAATGLLSGLNAARLCRGEPFLVPPPTTAVGALIRYLMEADPTDFQPMNINFGLLPRLDARIKKKLERNLALRERALGDLDRWRAASGV